MVEAAALVEAVAGQGAVMAEAAVLVEAAGQAVAAEAAAVEAAALGRVNTRWCVCIWVGLYLPGHVSGLVCVYLGWSVSILVGL